MSVPICPACRKKPRRKRQYLCPGCWYTLPSGTRSALNRSDEYAAGRLQQLLDALSADTPLRSITIR